MVHKSTKSGLNEDEYLALVERIQRAMCIEPFRPDVTDVVVLIGTCRMLDREIKRLQAALAEMLESFTEPEDDNDILRRARAALGRDKDGYGDQK